MAEARTSMMKALKRGLIRLADASPIVQRAAHYIVRNTSTGAASRDHYGYLRAQFLSNGRVSRYDSVVRAELLRRFEAIDAGMPIASTPTDGLFLAEMILGLDAPGDLVECGSYAGGSSAKLSVLARIVGRRVVIFDSFAGLPAVEGTYLRDHHCRRSASWVEDWTAGRYAASLEEVRANIERLGEASVCTLVRGWFRDTLTDANLPERIAFAFADVDLATSAGECFEALWPRLSERGLYVTHDTAYIKVLQALYSPELWRDRLRGIPPVLFGAGYGLCDDSPHIGYMVKGDSLSPDYLKSLTIDK